MRYDPDIHSRHSIRLSGFDYSTVGAYFVTICVQGRECLLGEVIGGQVVPNAAGEMVTEWWRKIPERFDNARLDEFIVMPNHFHAIVAIVGAPRVGALGPEPTQTRTGTRLGAGTRPAPTLGDIVGAFKSLTTVEYTRGVNSRAWPTFPGRLWQRNYYERVIRDEAELHAARAYVRENPLKWDMDKENPGGWM